MHSVPKSFMTNFDIKSLFGLKLIILLETLTDKQIVF